MSKSPTRQARSKANADQTKSPRQIQPAPAIAMPFPEVVRVSPTKRAERIRRACAVLAALAQCRDLMIRTDLRVAIAEIADDTYADAYRLVDELSGGTR